MTKYVVKIDYKKFTFEDSVKALYFAETANLTKDGNIDVAIEFEDYEDDDAQEN